MLLLLKVLFQTEGALATGVARDTGYVTRGPRGDGETPSWRPHRRPSSNTPRDGRKKKRRRRRRMMMMKISAWRRLGERLCVHQGRPTRSPGTPPSPPLSAPRCPSRRPDPRLSPLRAKRLRCDAMTASLRIEVEAIRGCRVGDARMGRVYTLTIRSVLHQTGP
jgi:hypothetical protein